MERMHHVAHSGENSWTSALMKHPWDPYSVVLILDWPEPELLTSEQSQKNFISPKEDAAQFLITKLAPHRISGPVAKLQVKVAFVRCANTQLGV